MSKSIQDTNSPIERDKLPICYVQIPSIVFFWLSIVTFGFYRMYWFYANWRAIKKAESSNISPFWRALFGVFFAEEFFAYACNAAKSKGYKGFAQYHFLYSCYLISISVIVLCYIASLAIKPHLLSYTSLVDWKLVIRLGILVFIFIKYLSLLPIITAVNFYQDKLEQEYLLKVSGSTSQVIGYLKVTPIRFLILNIITARLYSLYWQYKNWQAIKRASDQDIMPFARSVFPLFFIYGLFKKIYLSARNQGYPYKLPYWQLALGYVFSVFLLGFFIKRIQLFFNMSEFGYYLFFLSLGIIFDFLFFWPMQRAIDFYHLHAIPNYKPRRSITQGEIILCCIGLLVHVMLLSELARI